MLGKVRRCHPSTGLGLSRDCAVVAAELVESRPDVLLPGGDQACGLHDEHDRVVEHDVAEGEQEPCAVFERRCGLQADVSGLAQHQQAMDNVDPELERGAQPVRRPLRRPGADGRARLKFTYTDRLESPRIAIKPR